MLKIVGVLMFLPLHMGQILSYFSLFSGGSGIGKVAKILDLDSLWANHQLQNWSAKALISIPTEKNLWKILLANHNLASLF